MMQCPKCNRKRRVIERLEQQKGKKYWIERCAECKTPITLKPYFKPDTDFKIDK